jgi:membrane protease YdiL (CAAX protease family)
MPLKKFERLVLTIAIVLPTIVTWIYFVSLKDSSATVQQSAYGIGKTIQFALPVVWVWLFCQEKLNSLLPWANGEFQNGDAAENSANLKPSQSTMWAIGFGAFVAASVFVGFYFIVTPMGLADALVAQVNDKVSGMSLDTPMKFIFLGLFYALVHSFMEEYYWRWFVFKRLLQHVPFWIAVIISSLGFMAHHVILMATFLGWDSPLAYLISATVAIGGVVWALLYHRSGKLAYPWLSHMIVDAAIFALGYVLVFGVR